MDDKAALIVLTGMHVTATMDVASLESRLKDLNADYAKDRWEDTAAQIRRIASRVTRRRIEAEALSIAITKF